VTGLAISTVAVLAGGLATRMRPLTETIPKALLDVAGEPFVVHQLRLFKREGLARVVLCVGYRGEQIVDFVGDGSRFGLEVSYSFDGDRLLGTGGALRKTLPHLGDPFYVIYGDSYLDIPYAPVAGHFFASGKESLMTVFRNEGRWDQSNVVFEQGTILAYSKTSARPDMYHIDYGLGILRASTILAHGEDEVFDLADVYGILAARGQLAGYEAPRRFYEIGSLAGLSKTEAYIVEQKRRLASDRTPP
jgi:NDP-sugar pyrophosphorylase family protein